MEIGMRDFFFFFFFLLLFFFWLYANGLDRVGQKGGYVGTVDWVVEMPLLLFLERGKGERSEGNKS